MRGSIEDDKSGSPYFDNITFTFLFFSDLSRKLKVLYKTLHTDLSFQRHKVFGVENMRFSNFGCTKTCTSDTGCFRSPSLLRLSRSYPNRRGGPSPFPSSPTPLSPPLGLRTYPETS